MPIGEDGLLDVGVLTGEQLQQLHEYERESANELGFGGMPDIDTFWRKTYLILSLWPQVKDGRIMYLFGKGHAVEVALRGDIKGRQKREVSFSYRTHSDFDLYGVATDPQREFKYKVDYVYTPVFKKVFTGQEAYVAAKFVRGLPEAVQLEIRDLMHKNEERVDLGGGVTALAPELEILFLDKFIMREGTPREDGIDAEILARAYVLDGTKVLGYFDKYYASYALENIEKERGNIGEKVDNAIFQITTYLDGYARERMSLEESLDRLNNLRGVYTMWSSTFGLPQGFVITEDYFDSEENLISEKITPLMKKEFERQLDEEKTSIKDRRVELESLLKETGARFEKPTLETQLQSFAFKSSLANLNNIIARNEYLSNDIEEGDKLSILHTNIQAFKELINDRFGHAVGDKYISAVGSELEALVKEEIGAGKYETESRNGISIIKIIGDGEILVSHEGGKSYSVIGKNADEGLMRRIGKATASDSFSERVMQKIEPEYKTRLYMYTGLATRNVADVVNQKSLKAAKTAQLDDIGSLSNLVDVTQQKLDAAKSKEGSAFREFNDEVYNYYSSLEEGHLVYNEYDFFGQEIKSKGIVEALEKLETESSEEGKNSLVKTIIKSSITDNGFFSGSSIANAWVQQKLAEGSKIKQIDIDLNFFGETNTQLGVKRADKLKYGLLSIMEEAVGGKGVVFITGGDEIKIIADEDANAEKISSDIISRYGEFAENDIITIDGIKTSPSLTMHTTKATDSLAEKAKSGKLVTYYLNKQGYEGRTRTKAGGKEYMRLNNGKISFEEFYSEAEFVMPAEEFTEYTQPDLGEWIVDVIGEHKPTEKAVAVTAAKKTSESKLGQTIKEEIIVFSSKISEEKGIEVIPAQHVSRLTIDDYLDTFEVKETGQIHRGTKGIVDLEKKAAYIWPKETELFHLMAVASILEAEGKKELADIVRKEFQKPVQDARYPEEVLKRFQGFQFTYKDGQLYNFHLESRLTALHSKENIKFSREDIGEAVNIMKSVFAEDIEITNPIQVNEYVILEGDREWLIDRGYLPVNEPMLNPVPTNS